MLKKISSKSKKECFICYDEINSPLKLMNTYIIHRKCNCNEYIHKSCLNKCLLKKNACPLCNTPLNNNKAILLNNYITRYNSDTVIFRGSIYRIYTYNNNAFFIFFKFFCYQIIITISSITFAILLFVLSIYYYTRFHELLLNGDIIISGNLLRHLSTFLSNLRSSSVLG